MFKEINFHIKGLVPTILANGQVANPLNEYAKKIKEITDKPTKKRTDADWQRLAELQWESSIYVDDQGHPGWPAVNIESMIYEASRAFRKGKQTKAGLFLDGEFCPLIYKGPQAIEGLRKDKNFWDSRIVRSNNGANTITRPIFREWELKFKVLFDDSMLTGDNVIDFVKHAGQYIGLSSFHPRFGRFEVIEVA